MDIMQEVTDRAASLEVSDKLQNPLHPSMIAKLDPSFVQLYNDHIATAPPPPKDLALLRETYSSRYAYATADATGVGGIGEASVPGWSRYEGDVDIRVYIPPQEGETRKTFPVHFNLHGGGWAVGEYVYPCIYTTPVAPILPSYAFAHVVLAALRLQQRYLMLIGSNHLVALIPMPTYATVSHNLPSNLCCRFRSHETKNLQIPNSILELTGALDICAQVPCCVIDIAYRLVPEFPFPTAIMDGLTAIAYVLSNAGCFYIDPDNITIGGESCGATIGTDAPESVH